MTRTCARRLFAIGVLVMGIGPIASAANPVADFFAGEATIKDQH